MTGRVDLLEQLVALGQRAAHGSDADPAALASCVGELGRDQRATQVLSAHLIRVSRSLWENGWQPADAVHVVRRGFTVRAAGVAKAAIGDEARTSGAFISAPATWRDQLAALGVKPIGDAERRNGLRRMITAGNDERRVLADGLRVVALWRQLPRLPRLTSPPSAWGERSIGGRNGEWADDDTKVLLRIRSLLAKAESTDFGEEADAFTTKAQQLMARHSIDQAVIDLMQGTTNDLPKGRRVHISDPYALARVQLVSAAASANNARTVWSATCGFVTVFGYQVDLDIVSMLYTSLELQANRALALAGLGGPKFRSRSFRTSFLSGYAVRVGERLRQARADEEVAASKEHGAGLLPILWNRRAVVEAVQRDAFPQTTSQRLDRINLRGWSAGITAADAAGLVSRPSLSA